jgi:hypothetical protein
LETAALAERSDFGDGEERLEGNEDASNDKTIDTGCIGCSTGGVDQIGGIEVKTSRAAEFGVRAA